MIREIKMEHCKRKRYVSTSDALLLQNAKVKIIKDFRLQGALNV